VQAAYLVLVNTSSLSNERQFVAGNGLKSTDLGANSTFSIFLDDSIVAMLTGSTFSGPVKAAGGLSGSLQRTTAGLPFLVAGLGVTVSSASNGQITIGSSPPTWVDAGGKIYTTSSVAISNPGMTAEQTGNDVFFYVSGTVSASSGGKVAAFGGDVCITGSLRIGVVNAANSPPGLILSSSGIQFVNGKSFKIGAGPYTAAGGPDGSTVYIEAGTATSASGQAGHLFLDPGPQGPGAAGYIVLGSQNQTSHIVLATATTPLGPGSDPALVAQALDQEAYLFVSGTIGLSGSSAARKSIFGGDTYVSGAMNLKNATTDTASLLPKLILRITWSGGTPVVNRSVPDTFNFTLSHPGLGHVSMTRPSGVTLQDAVMTIQGTQPYDTSVSFGDSIDMFIYDAFNDAFVNNVNYTIIFY